MCKQCSPLPIRLESDWCPASVCWQVRIQSQENAIQLDKSIPFIGIGNELHQYCIESTGKTHHVRLNLKFKSKIYGICSLSDAASEEPSCFVVVYGGRELAILANVGEPNVNVLQCLALNDWISTVHIYKSIENATIHFCALTSHSLAMEIEANELGVWKIVNRSASVDKSTLYCSKVLGTQWSTTTVLGGTALGELIVWSVKSGDVAREIIHRLSGHNVSLQPMNQEKFTRWKVFRFPGRNIFDRLQLGPQFADHHIRRSLGENLDAEFCGQSTRLALEYIGIVEVGVRPHCPYFCPSNHRICRRTVHRVHWRRCKYMHLDAWRTIASPTKGGRWQFGDVEFRLGST